MELIEVVRIFNLEHKFKFSRKATDFILNWGKYYLKTYKLVNIDNDNEDKLLTETIKTQMNEFISRHNDFSTINIDNEKLKKKYSSENKHYDIKLLWNHYLSSHYELVNIATAILSICPSESSVERSFSLQSDVHSLERNKLSDELIEAEMHMKMNV